MILFVETENIMSKNMLNKRTRPLKLYVDPQQQLEIQTVNQKSCHTVAHQRQFNDSRETGT